MHTELFSARTLGYSKSMIKISAPFSEGLKRVSLTLLAAAFCFFAWRTHWADSEIWSISLAKNLFSDHHPSMDYKWLFNLLLRAIYVFSDETALIFRNARLLFAAIGLSTLICFYKIMSRFDGKDTAFWGTLFFMLTTLFLSQGYAVRSDLLACFFQALGLWHFLSLNPQNNQVYLSRFSYVLGALFAILMLLSTPKAIYQLIINFVFMYFCYRQTRSAWIKKYLWSTFGFPILFFAAFSLARWPQFDSALEYFFVSYQSHAAKPGYWSMKAFEYIFQIAGANFIITFALAWGFLNIKKLKSLHPLVLPTAVGTAASFAFIILHNDRLPFFILSLMILPMMFAGFTLNHIGKKKINQALLVTLGLINLAISFDHCYKMVYAVSNRAQKDAIFEMESYLARHNWPLYYDAIAVLPLKNQIYALPAPEHPQNFEEVMRVLDLPGLNLVFFANRLFPYMNPFLQGLEERYFISIGAGVFARTHAMRSSHVMTSQEWAQVCMAFSNPPVMYVYTGTNFMNMWMKMKLSQSCHLPYRPIKTDMPFIAFTPYDPIYLARMQDFAQLFDYRYFIKN